MPLRASLSADVSVMTLNVMNWCQLRSGLVMRVFQIINDDVFAKKFNSQVASS